MYLSLQKTQNNCIHHAIALTLLICIAYSSPTLSHTDLTGGHLLVTSPQGGVCPKVVYSGGVSHLFLEKLFIYCFYRHSDKLDCSKVVNDNNAEFCTPPPPPSGPLASTINNGQNSCSKGNPNNYTANPINTATGNKFFTHHYFAGQGTDPIRLDFFYNSNTNNAIWTHTYSQSLVIDGNHFEAKRPDGQVLSFINNQGLYAGLNGRLETLEKISQSNQYSFALPIYQLTLQDKTVELYNEQGWLLSIEYPSGIIHQFIRTSETADRGFIRRVNKDNLDDYSDLLELYFSDGEITFARYKGKSFTYGYNEVGGINHLTSITYADNTTRTYLYENPSFPHHITGIIDENDNRISSVEYDNEGRAISSEVGTPDSGIERTDITYHNDGARTVTNSLGKQNTYHFTQFNGEYKMTQVEGHASNHCAAANQAYTYDSNGFMASKTDWQGNITTYAYNDRGLEISRTEASGTPQARTISTAWHLTLNLPTKITEPEHETVFSYDANGRLLSTEVNPR